jgi:hypothetical protein
VVKSELNLWKNERGKEVRTTFVVIWIPEDAGAAEEVGEEVEVGL